MVYGHPAVAVAIDAGVEVSIRESSKWTMAGVDFDPSQHPHITHILRDVFKYNGVPLEIDVKSGLFSAAGLGSSAAISNAMGAALQFHIDPDGELDRIGLARMGHSAEAIAQKGRASPTDTAASALGGCVVVSGELVSGTTHIFDASLETPEGERTWSISRAIVPEGLDAWIVLGFTGIGSPTGRMVAGVASLLQKDPSKETEMEAIGKITHAGLAALSAGNLEGVGIAMNACHERLKSLNVSSPELERLIEAAKPHSLGVKLTGAGGGGCMVSLTRDPRRVAEAIEIAGGRPLISKLGADGVNILT